MKSRQDTHRLDGEIQSHCNTQQMHVYSLCEKMHLPIYREPYSYTPFRYSTVPGTVHRYDTVMAGLRRPSSTVDFSSERSSSHTVHCGISLNSGQLLQIRRSQVTKHSHGCNAARCMYMMSLRLDSTPGRSRVDGCDGTSIYASTE